MRSKIDQKRSIWIIVALFVVLGLVSLLVFQFVFAEGNRLMNRCEGTEIAKFRTQFALLPNADTQARKKVQEKIESWETLIAVCETVTPPTVIPLENIQFTPWSPPSINTGIFEGQPGAFFRANDAKIENHWRGVVNGQSVIVFAGVWVGFPDQGFVAVVGNPRSRNPLMGNFPSRPNPEHYALWIFRDHDWSSSKLILTKCFILMSLL